METDKTLVVDEKSQKDTGKRSLGTKFSVMTPYEMKSLAIAKFGPDGWITKLSRAMAVNERTVRRWYYDECPITQRVASHIKLVCQ